MLQLTGHKLLYHLDELSKWQKGVDFYPIHLDISPTGYCNHRCFHCYIDYLGHKRGSLRKDVFLKFAEEIGTLGVKSVFIAGTGEPFLNKATIDAISITNEHGTDVGVATNGILLNRKKLEKILPHLTWLRFSILGGTPKTYAYYHGASENDWYILNENMSIATQIRKEKNLNVNFGAVYCILPENGKEVGVMAGKLKEIGFDYLVIKPVSQNPKNNLDVGLYLHKRFESELKHTESLSDDSFKVIVRYDQFNCLLRRDYDKCYGLPFIAVVSEDGGVYACNGYWNNPDFCYGNLYEKSFKEIWDSERKKKIQKQIETYVDFNNCEPVCRLNSINKFLWGLKNIPEHVNFI